MFPREIPSAAANATKTADAEKIVAAFECNIGPAAVQAGANTASSPSKTTSPTPSSSPSAAASSSSSSAALLRAVNLVLKINNKCVAELGNFTV